MQALRMFITTSLVLFYASSVLANGLFANYSNFRKIYAMALEDNYLWCGTSGGILRLNKEDGSVVKFPGYAKCMAIDHNNVKWFGNQNGLSRLDGTSLTTYTTENGLIDNEVTSIAVDHDNRLLVATWAIIYIPSKIVRTHPGGYLYRVSLQRFDGNTCGTCQ